MLSAKNFVNNPSFETVSNAWPSSWSYEKKRCEAVTDVYRTGKYSMHCKSSTAGDTAGFYQINKNIFFGVKYKMTAYIRVKDISEGAYVIFFAESSNYIYGIYSYTNKIDVCKTGTCNDKWYVMQGTSEMNFGKAGHYVIGFDLRPSNKATGEFWVDDVSLEMIETDILKSVLVKTYKSEVYKSEVEILVDLAIINSVFENGEYITIKVQIEDSDDPNKIYKVLENYKLETRMENRVAVFKWNPSSLPENKIYTIRAKTVNSLFSNRTEEAVTYAKKLNHTPSYKFYVDEHNIAWKDGKKFFPIGLYFQSNNEKDLDYLKDSSFNLVKVPGFSKSAIEKIYTYTKGKIFVLNNLNVAHSSRTDKEWLAQVRAESIKKINEVKDAKGLIGYYIADEPPINNLMSIRETTLTIREFDPDKIAWPALLRTELFHQWKELFDVGGIDCYPVQSYEALEDIWVIFRRARNLVINSKPIWGIPQFFTWELYYPEKSYGGPPTEDQLRQMTYQFISAGANGLIYFDFHEMMASNSTYPFEKEWAKLKRVTDELAKTYVPIILSESSVNPGYKIPAFDDIMGYNYFGRRLFRYNGYDYLLIVNVRNKACVAEITIPETTTSIEKMMGKAKMTVDKTKVTLDMPAADVVWLKGYDTDWKPADGADWLCLWNKIGVYLTFLALILF